MRQRCGVDGHFPMRDSIDKTSIQIAFERVHRRYGMEANRQIHAR